MKNITKQKISKSLKKHHQKKKFKRDLAYVITVTVILTYFFGMNNALQAIEREIPSERPQPYVFVEKSATEQTEANNEVLEEDVESIKAYIEREAVKHGINPEKMLALLSCENKSVDPKATYTNKEGSRDRGIFQINSYWHKEVSDECAYNAKCNIDEAFRILKQRGFKEWTCGRILNL